MGFVQVKTLDLNFGKTYWLYHLDLTAGEQITYHRAESADIEALVHLRLEFVIALSGAHPEKELGELRHALQEYFDDAIRRNTGIFYLAKHGHSNVGMGGLVIRESPGNFRNPSGRWGYLLNMYTIAAFRRKGICSRLIDLLVEDAGRAGVTAFELHATREGAMVYPGCGFEIHDEPTYRKYLQS